MDTGAWEQRVGQRGMALTIHPRGRAVAGGGCRAQRRDSAHRPGLTSQVGGRLGRKGADAPTAG